VRREDDLHYLRIPPGRPFTRLEKVLLAMLALFLIVACASVLVAGIAVKTVNDTQAEAKERINSTCRLFEGESLYLVQGVRSTYDFLDTLPKSDWGTPLTIAIVTRLKDQYRMAQRSSAPAYCDKQGVGLEEPSAADCAADRSTCNKLPALPPCGTAPPRSVGSHPCKDYSYLLKRP